MTNQRVARLSSSLRVAALAALAAAAITLAGAAQSTELLAMAQQQERITAQDVLSVDPIPADERIAYGELPMQFGDLRVPDGDGPWPVAILIHGGCWRDIATLQYFDRVAEAITDMGVATWNIEYRPVDVEGGGWPGTFLDVGAGVDKLRDIAPEHGIDTQQVIVVGHSAGGHLALWAAGRPRVPEDSELYVDDPLPIGGVVSLAGIPELRRFRALESAPCGEGVVDRLMGGGPREVPDHYIAGSPFQMLPLNVQQIHITGRDDETVPFRQVSPYNYESQSAGDSSQLVVVPDAGHFEVVWPGTPAWERVEEAVRSLLGL